MGGVEYPANPSDEGLQSQVRPIRGAMQLHYPSQGVFNQYLNAANGVTGNILNCKSDTLTLPSWRGRDEAKRRREDAITRQHEDVRMQASESDVLSASTSFSEVQFMMNR